MQSVIMEGATSEGQENNGGVETVEVVEWDIYQEVWEQLCGLKMVHIKAVADKMALMLQMKARLEVRKVALEREDALEAIERQVDAKKLRLKSDQEALRNSREELARKTECFVPSSRALQVAFKALSDTRRRLQVKSSVRLKYSVTYPKPTPWIRTLLTVDVAELLLSGDGGRERLRRLCYLLDVRRRRTLAEVFSVYPVVSLKPEISSTQEVEREAVNKDGSSLVIAGMALSEPGKKLSGLAKEKIENDMSATALGYVGHVVTLAARYLDVQLRYPIRQMASRSFIQDYCPAIEPPAVDAVTVSVAPQYGSQRLVVEFPLFSEGQDTTRSAYAVFLLNKDLEQILNHLGLESVGPRHTLLNLEKLIKVVLSRKHPLA